MIKHTQRDIGFMCTHALPHTHTCVSIQTHTHIYTHKTAAKEIIQELQQQGFVVAVSFFPNTSVNKLNRNLVAKYLIH